MDSLYVRTYSLVTVICAMIGLVIRYHASYDMGSRKTISAFRNFLLFYVLFVISNGVCLWANHTRNIPLGTLFSGLTMLALFISGFFWFIYIELRLGSALSQSKGLLVFSAVPLLLSAALILTTHATHLVYYYSPEGEFRRGPLYFAMFFCGLLYLAFASAHVYGHLKYVKTQTQRRQYLYLISFLLFPILGGLLDLLLPHLPVMELLFLLGIVLIYLSLQQSQIYIDALTGLNNRRATAEYLEEHIPALSPDNPLHFFMADLNGFKKVNDVYGHEEGDKALRILSQELADFAGRHHWHVGRWGGDEFVLIVQQTEPLDAEQVIRELEQALEKRREIEQLPYPLRLAVGATQYTTPSVTVAQIVSEADRMMYENKRKAQSS